MPPRDSIALLILGAIFAVWSGAGLIYGKVWNPNKHIWFGGFVERRKDPGDYWFYVALPGGLALFILASLTVRALLS